MKKRIALVLALIIALSSVLLTGCGHKHDFREIDDRVVCVDCKETCTHEYEIDGSKAYCSNCLFSCKHSFKEDNGNMICDDCGIVCTHEYNENSVCKHCESECVHEYESTPNGSKCKICNADCEHIFENSDLCKICGNTCTHEFGYYNDGYQCKYCSEPCEHEYENISGKSLCSKCGNQKIILNMSNINDYFSINAKVYDVNVKKDYYLGTRDSGECKVDVTVRSKKDVKYKDVVVTVLLETTATGWANRSIEIEVSYDGYGEGTTKILSYILDYVYSSPSYRASISDVSGEIEL